MKVGVLILIPDGFLKSSYLLRSSRHLKAQFVKLGSSACGMPTAPKRKKKSHLDATYYSCNQLEAKLTFKLFNAVQIQLSFILEVFCTHTRTYTHENCMENLRRDNARVRLEREGGRKHTCTY